MRGVILAGGRGTRMGMFTRRVGNKHVIPVYNRPMIEYPLSTFSQAGIKDLAIVSSNYHVGDICKLVGNGKEFGFDSVSYFVQVGESPGIADALKLVRNFARNDNFAVILGDNIFEDNITSAIHDFDQMVSYRARIFLKEVHDPQRFGVAECDSEGNVIGLEEKPKAPKSNWAVTGLYFFDPSAFDLIQALTPSHRGELEITDLLKMYLEDDRLSYNKLNGFWSDAGTPESCLKASNWLASNELQLSANGRWSNYRFARENGLGDYL